MRVIDELEKEEAKRLARRIPAFAPGDTLRVNVRIREGDRVRFQACWARPKASRRRVSRTGSWSIRSSPGRGRSRGVIFRRFCSAATTPRWPGGEGPSGRLRRESGGRISGRRISPINRQRARQAR